ncbi:MAG TPA: YggT family protein [Nostocaceae cyanobacterium]|nr:YggT family protein [Nostocaceae cyanobacterium]
MFVISFLLLFIQVYSALLFVRVALTWFPNINWYNQPFNALAQLTDPYLDLFRSLLPSFGGIDLSPMLGVIVLQLIGQVAVQGLSLIF